MVLFERSEFMERVSRTKTAMRRAGIDVLLVASPANQFYLTGYDGWSFYTPQMVVVSLDREEPFWFGRKMDAVGAKFTAFLSSENVVPYPDKYVGSSDLHPMQYLAELIGENGWDSARIGVEMDDYYYTARWHQILDVAATQGRLRRCVPPGEPRPNDEISSGDRIHDAGWSNRGRSHGGRAPGCGGGGPSM